jgi:hypothetical protein
MIGITGNDEPGGPVSSTNSPVADDAHLRPLAPGIWAYFGARGDSNAGAIETPDGLVAALLNYPIDDRPVVRASVRSAGA